ncbi:MAG: hypothetical protein ACLR8Y_16825 [Alistipes indistinctus]
MERGGDGLRFLRSAGYRQRALDDAGPFGRLVPDARLLRGRYRDRQMVEVQAELRQHIYNRHGVAVWVGAGNVFPTFGEFNPRTHCPTMAWDTVGSSKIKSTSGSTTGSVKARTASCSRYQRRRFDAQPVVSGVVRAGVLFGGCRRVVRTVGMTL